MCRFSGANSFSRGSSASKISKAVFGALVGAACLSSANAAGSQQPAPLTSTTCAFMVAHKALRVPSTVPCRRLATVKFSYLGFDSQAHADGEIVVLDAAAERVEKIFKILLDRRFPIAKARLIENYDGNDDASMSDNNTSALNDRPVTGSAATSLHAYGLAIDINPVQNPFIQRLNGKTQVSPAKAIEFTKRDDIRPGMAESIVDIFADNGFPIWGGDWRSPIDYQHFQVSRGLAVKLARSPSAAAKVMFEAEITRYRSCRKTGRSRKACSGNS